MTTIKITWKEFRILILEHIVNKSGARICRGQANSEWKLATSFHRYNLKKISFGDYFEKIIPHIADAIGTLEGREIDVTNATVNGAFLAYAQHHGLPTPLLDWTFSPYTAAYYAFSGIEDTQPKSDLVAIYVLDHERWIKNFTQVYDFTSPDSHVSILHAKSKGNHRQISQQGIYIFTNVEDIEDHISALETTENTYLTKYLFSVKEKPIVMQELETMGINAYTLFGGTLGMFQFYKESLFRSEAIGETPAEKMAALLERHIKNSPQYIQEEFPFLHQLNSPLNPLNTRIELKNDLQIGDKPFKK